MAPRRRQPPRRRWRAAEELWRKLERSRQARVLLGDRPEGTVAAPPGGNGVPPGPPRLRPRNGRPKLKKLRVALVLLGLALLASVSWVFGIMMSVAQDLPKLENRTQYLAAKNSVISDFRGRRIATVTNNEGRILVGSSEIAPTVKEAVVAIEDQRFYEHRGVDFKGIARALYQDILARSAAQGASTITQQFVKNALQAQENRSILQKLRESALAYHLERQWSKDKILTEYLSSIYLGEGAYGIEAAARAYFGWAHRGCGRREGRSTCASQLLPWEAALLAGMISSPSGYSPRANPKAALQRRNLVLEQMMEQGYITEQEYEEYSDPEKHPIPTPQNIRSREEESRAPYFTSWLRQQLVDRYGAGRAFGGGLQVTSTLDLDLQKRVEGVVQDRLGGVGPTAAIVVLDNKTAAVRAMVGGSDYQKQPFNVATQGHRQPGSAFKPFTLVTALSNGVSPDRVFESAPQKIPFDTVIETDSGPRTVNEIFKVKNYEDEYLGTASVTTATTYSDNAVYAQLGVEQGPGEIAETAEEMGIQTPLSVNPAMILGGLETGVTPLEMAHAYETLAMGGKRVSGTLAASPDGPVGIEKVIDEEGDLVKDDAGVSGQNRVETRQVLFPSVAETAVDILFTVITSGTGQNAFTGELAWGKTGTTDDNADAWFCGATEETTVCIWVGNPNSATPMKIEFGGLPVNGGTFPAQIFSDIIRAYEELQAVRGEDDEDEEEQTITTTPTYTPTTTTPTTTTTPEETTTEPEEPEDADEEKEQKPPPPPPSEPPPEDDGPSGGGAPGGLQPGGQTRRLLPP